MLREELRQTHQTLLSWQESWRQAKAACEAWKKEAEEVTARARLERDGSSRRVEEVGEGELAVQCGRVCHVVCPFSSSWRDSCWSSRYREEGEEEEDS